MGREQFQQLEGGVVKRKVRRRLGLFIDGTGLDRATRRLERKVDLSRLVAGLTSGLVPDVARYYTLVPYEDDARQFAFLDAVERAGLEVVVKRLPPKGVKRQVSMDVHMASDIIAHAYGHFAEEQKKEAANAEESKTIDLRAAKAARNGGGDANVQRMGVIVCPSRELSYAIYLGHSLGMDTHLADFGLYGNSDGWKGVDRWVDLSNSETIWRD